MVYNKRKPSCKVVPQNSIKVIPLKRTKKCNTLQSLYMTLVICSISYFIGFIIIVKSQDRHVEDINIHILTWGAFLIGFAILNICIFILGKFVFRLRIENIWDYLNCICCIKA